MPLKGVKFDTSRGFSPSKFQNEVWANILIFDHKLNDTFTDFKINIRFNFFVPMNFYKHFPV